MLHGIIETAYKVSPRLTLEQCGNPKEHQHLLGRKQYLKAAVLAVACVAASSQPGFAAATLKVLYQLPGSTGGEYPTGTLYQDKSGNLFGASSGDPGKTKKGITDFGTVFEISPPTAPGAGWKTQIIYTFPSNGAGAHPTGGLIADSSGNLYGITGAGGNNGGVIYKLTPPASGQTNWTESVIFQPLSFPVGGLLWGKNGVLYAVCELGVYSFTPPKNGQGAWTSTGLASIPLNAGPTAGVAADANGVLYYTTQYGGTGNGVVYSLTPPASGQTSWTQGVVYQFQGGTNDGATPVGNLVIDKSGDIYGTTNSGGKVGTIYKLAPPASGQSTWTETILHIFTGGTEGNSPEAGLTPQPNGDFYGTASGGPLEKGVVFKLTPTTGGTGYTYSVVYTFANKSPKAPNLPIAPVIRGNNGALFGTTIYGGNVKPPCKPAGCGTVFEVLP